MKQQEPPCQISTTAFPLSSSTQVGAWSSCASKALNRWRRVDFCMRHPGITACYLVSKVVEIMAIAGAYWISPWKQCEFYVDLTDFNGMFKRFNHDLSMILAVNQLRGLPASISHDAYPPYFEVGRRWENQSSFVPLGREVGTQTQCHPKTRLLKFRGRKHKKSARVNMFLFCPKTGLGHSEE